ncbi:MAG: ribonuclease P [Candidatus Woesearchaeota archaeon]
MKKREANKGLERQSSLQQVQALFDAAALVFPKSPSEANRLIAKAHRLVLRSKLKLPSVLKRRYCKHCKAFWVPGKSVRVRLAKGRIVYSCLSCRKIQRMPIKC